MIVNLKDQDLKRFEELLKIKDTNINISDMLLTAFCYIDFLNIDEIKRSDNEHDAIIENLVRNFSDDKDSSLLSSHIRLSCLDQNEYLNDYSNKLLGLKAKYKNYHLETMRYEPYQLFAYSDIEVINELEISKVGYFRNEFSYPAIFENDNLWMSLNPNEINTMKPFLSKANGSVLVLGLGLGYVPYMLSKKSDIKDITIVENNHDNIVFFNKFIAPLFDNKKYKIIEEDALKFIDKNNDYNYIFADLWFTPEDGVEYLLKLEKIEKSKNIKIYYWLEQSLRQMKRRYMIELINESLKGFSNHNYVSKESVEDRVFRELYYQTKNKIISSFDEIKELLK